MEFVSSGKWILAGEHSVLRGSRALVFPLPAMQTKLIYSEGTTDLSAQFFGLHGEDYQLLFYGLVDRALEILGRPRKDLMGSVKLKSNLPLGNGLGASAALCVVVGQWLSELGWVDPSKLESFCRELENLFHGESSGVDVAVVLSRRPLIFSRYASSTVLNIGWKPHFYLSPTGQKGLTHACVQKVKEFLLSNPNEGKKIDYEMSQSVESMARILIKSPGEWGDSRLELIEQLKCAINQARACFESWGLTEGSLDREMKRLMDLGALAVKPTGSGAGGYVLSLWLDEPPDHMILKNKDENSGLLGEKNGNLNQSLNPSTNLNQCLIPCW